MYENSSFTESSNEKNGIRLCKGCEQAELVKSKIKGKPWDFNMITGWVPLKPMQMKPTQKNYTSGGKINNEKLWR